MGGVNKITREIIKSGIKVHKTLGAGLLENAYQECLFYEMRKNGLWAEKEKPLPLRYESVKLDCGYRLDLLVEKQVIVEVKAVESLERIHLAQVLTYLKLAGCRFGLLMNFNSIKLVDGIKRVVND